MQSDDDDADDEDAEDEGDDDEDEEEQKGNDADVDDRREGLAPRYMYLASHGYGTCTWHLFFFCSTSAEQESKSAVAILSQIFLLRDPGRLPP